MTGRNPSDPTQADVDRILSIQDAMVVDSIQEIVGWSEAAIHREAKRRQAEDPKATTFGVLMEMFREAKAGDLTAPNEGLRT